MEGKQRFGDHRSIGQSPGPDVATLLPGKLSYQNQEANVTLQLPQPRGLLGSHWALSQLCSSILAASSGLSLTPLAGQLLLAL